MILLLMMLFALAAPISLSTALRLLADLARSLFTRVMQGGCTIARLLSNSLLTVVSLAAR